MHVRIVSARERRRRERGARVHLGDHDPAAANIGGAAAYGRGGEAWGAFSQLALNLVLIVTAGAVTFAVERWVDRRVHRRRRPLP